MPIKEGTDGITGPMVILDGSGGTFAQTILPELGKSKTRFPHVGLTGDKLYIVANDPSSCLDTALDLMRERDRKYFYPGPLPWRVHTNAVGIVGKYIDFEGHLRGSAPKL